MGQQQRPDGHAGSASVKDFRTKIDSIRLSDYDQRLYKTLSLGPARNGGSSRSIFVITHVDIGGQGTNAAMRANHFTVIEEWQSAKATDTHAAAAHTKEYRNNLASIAGGPLDERPYRIVE